MISTHIVGYSLVGAEKITVPSSGAQRQRLSGEVLITRDGSRLGIYLMDKPTWNGEGLPPVGTECLMSDGKVAGVVVKIMAHDGCLAVFGYEGEYRGLTAKAFRKIKTVSQIQQEEREAAIKEMLADARQEYTVGEALCTVSALYDAGYRKQADHE